MSGKKKLRRERRRRLALAREATPQPEPDVQPLNTSPRVVTYQGYRWTFRMFEGNPVDTLDLMINPDRRTG